MNKTEFLWTFPCFVLASRFNTSDSGHIILDEDILFVAPFAEDGSQRLAIFTDHDAVLDYLDCCDGDVSHLTHVPIPTARDLLQLLVRSQLWTRVWVDLNPKAGMSRSVPVAELILEIEHYLARIG